MLFTAAFNFIFNPLIRFPSYITASIHYAQGIRTAEALRSANIIKDYPPGSEQSPSCPGPDSDTEHGYFSNSQQTRYKHLPAPLDISSFHIPPQKRPFTIPFVSGLQSKLLAATGTGASGGPKRSNAAEGQLLGECFLSSPEKSVSSEAAGSSTLPCSIKLPYTSHSANAAAFAPPKSQLASTLCPQFRRSKLSSSPGTHSSSHPSNTSPPITERRTIGTPPLKGPFVNFVHLPPPLPPDQLYTTHPVLQQQSTPRAACTPAPKNGMADPTFTSSPKPTAATPKNIPWNRVYEIHTSQLRGHLRFLKLLAANKGHSQPLTQCISRAETLLKDAATAAAASGISTAGPVPAKPEKRRRSVRFEDEVAKQGKPDKKTRTAYNPIQRPKMRHAKPSEAQIAALSSALGKRGRDEPSDSDDSSVGSVINVIKKKIRKEYYTPGMVLEYESSDDEDDEEFAPPDEEGEKGKQKADSDSDESEDAEEVEQDPSPSPEVDRKRSRDGGMEGKRATDKDMNRTRTAKEDAENATAAKDVPESSKKRKIVVISIPGRTKPLAQEEGEAGRGKRIRPS